MRWAIAVVFSSACFDPSFNRPACGPGGECPAGLSCVAGSCGAAPGPVDAGDVADAAVCFGTGVVQLCLAAAPTRELTLIGDAGQPINTDTGCPEVVAQAGDGPELCVFSGTSVQVTGLLVAVGARPLVVVASDTVSVPAGSAVDVSSTISPRRRGAGAPGTLCTAESKGGNDNGGGGGGAGGSFGTVGGRGGAGDLDNTGAPAGEAAGGVPGPAITEPSALRGGCSGGSGGDADSPHAGGASGDGGGAVALIAGRSISIAGKVIASGAGGGADPGPAGIRQGGGGAGPGGMIVFDAPQIQVRLGARIVARGGMGGSGGSGTSGGPFGADGADNVGRPVNNGQDATGGGGGGSGGFGLIWTYGSLQSDATFSPVPVAR